MNYFLRQIIPPNSDESNPVQPIEIHFTQDEVHVGRRQIISLAKFPQISRDHAVFYKSDDGTLFVKDLNSLNGVYVNDVKIGSSLKVLNSGDVIGFGVTSSAIAEGFVCVLCAESRIKTEVIEISDDDNEPVASHRKSDSENSCIHVPILKVKNESNSHVKNEVTCHSNQESCSECGEVKNTSESQHDVRNIPCKVEPKSPENIPVRTFTIPLIRCDERDFQLPSDVKDSFQRNSKQKNVSNSEQKSVRKLISSDDSDRIIHLSASSNENRADLVLDNKYKNCKTDSSNQVVSNKRKFSDVPDLEASHHILSSSKKTDSFHHKIINNSETEVKSHLENQDDDKEENYSQVEHIIYISDDESYLDFKPSQDFIHIKQEPEEIEDCEIESDIYKEIFERESNYGEERLPCNSKVSPQNHDSDDRVESIESILAFVSNSEQKDSKVLKSDSHSVTNCVQIKSSIFPVPSQDTDSESSSEYDSDPSNNIDDKKYDSCGKIHKSEEENPISNILSAENKNIKKSGKILIIDPKPMSYRPRRLRGRDEGFVEKKTPLIQPAVVTTTPRKRKKKSVENEIPNFELKKSKSPHNSKLECEKLNQIPINKKYSSNSDIASTSKRNINSSQVNSSMKTQSETRLLGNVLENNMHNRNTVRKCEFPKSVNANVNFSSQHSSINVCVAEGKKHFTDKNTQKTTVAFLAPNNKLVKSLAAPNTEKVAAKFISPSTKRPSEAFFRHLKESKMMETLNKNCDLSPSTSCDISENTVSSPKRNSLLPYVNFDSILKKLLNLNTKWLQEQTLVKIPPSSVTKGAAYLPLSYKSYNSYVSSFYPMIMLEIWEYMYTESKEVYASNKQYKKFYFSILSYTGKEDCIELKCESVVNEKVCFGPREGVIAVLELKENMHKCCPLFGYIFKHKIEPLNLGLLKNSLWKNLPEEWLKNAKHWTFYAFIKKKDMSFELSSLMKGNGLCYIRTKLRLADALHSLQDSPLLKDILAPRNSTFATNHSLSSPTRQYNSSQTEVIKCVSNEINKPHKQPKIVLLQGPPGTGKTHVIVGILEKLFYISKNKSNIKILVTAPSNEAIDEIGCRLIELNKRSSLRDNDIKFVRVGLEKQIHPKMLPYFVDNKAKVLYGKSSQLANLKENEIQKFLSEINQLEMDPPSKGRIERIKYLKDQCKQLRNKNSVKIDYYTEMMYKTTVLQENHIILSTLNNCSLSLFHRSFKSNSSNCFSCCIVDDATQCTELEVLQPLMLGISKLVLVGDPKQLPVTVLSKLTAKYGFERSIFERFLLYFQNLNERPLYTLTEQFRMHSTICEFPSKYFYAHKLLTHPNISLKYKEFPLNPYIVLDISMLPMHPESTDQLPKGEVSVMSYICKFLGFTESQSSIGIIVPHQAKRSFYMKILHNHSCYKQIEVNTVDRYQGREKDIIILSVMGDNSRADGVSFLSCKKQLNVALTRARKCLIICANSAELMVYSHWRELILDARERKICISLPSLRDTRHVLENYIKKKN